MKYLTTRICAKPKAKLNKYYLSYDFEVWSSTNKLDKIKELYFDRFGCILNDKNIEEEENFQPKNCSSLNYFEEDFYPCILKVEDYQIWVDGHGFSPQQEIYESADLISIGYDVMETSFIGAISHGIYPVGEDCLNEFNLFDSDNKAREYVNINNAEIPEHTWKLVQLFINKGTYHHLKNSAK